MSMRGPRLIRVGFLVLIGFLLVSGVALPTLHHLLSGRAVSGDGDEHLARIASLPDFRLDDALGGTLSLADLGGHVWVADFIFTRCPSICKVMSMQMRRLQDALERELPPADAPRVRLVSFTVDPEWDTTERLAEYGKVHGADPERWHFLGGTRAEIMTLMERGFLLPTPPGGAESGAILHSSKFVLVDAAGTLRGFYDAQDKLVVGPLLRDIRALLDEGERSAR